MVTFKLEIKKVFKSKSFWAVILFAGILAILSAVFIIITCSKFQEMYHNFGTNPSYAFGDNAFANVISRDKSSVIGAMFYTFLPLVCVLGYGWSYASDLRSGYIKNIITRTGKRQYIISKYFATFISGGLVVLIPVVINIVVLACYMPFRMANPYWQLYYSEMPAFPFSKLFFTAPVLYLLISLVGHFLIGGLYATSSMVVSVFNTNKYIVALLPFVLSLIYAYICNNYLNNMFRAELDPTKFLTTSNSTYRVLFYIVLIYIVYFAITLIPIFYKGMKKDVF